MSSLIRPADREHFSIVRESLSLDGLHVAMVGRDRRQLLDYAAALAVTLAKQDGWHIEKYDPKQLETLIVDLMLNRFDAALQTLSGHARSTMAHRPTGCVLFIPDAQSIANSTFQQLVRLVSSTGHQKLRLVALFAGDVKVCEERIAFMGHQVARWELDGQDNSTSVARLQAFPGVPEHTIIAAGNGQQYRGNRRILAATVAAALMAVVALLPPMWPAGSEITSVFHNNDQSDIPFSSMTELAGVPVSGSVPIKRLPESDKDKVAEGSNDIGIHSDAGVVVQPEAAKQ